jgi:tRNA (cytidine/uridine-2'-O-)-methyltransferase
MILHMLDIILVEPEIPPNTGNVIRLCANTGMRLHLVGPLGFAMEDKHLRRAGLDYHEYANVTYHPNWRALRVALPAPTARWFALTTKGTRSPYEVTFKTNDILVFGSETRGLSAPVREEFKDEFCLRLPMVPGQRSLNLSNAVAITAYEAWRQLGFAINEPAGERA